MKMNNFGRAKLTDIRHFEAANRITLPEDYIEFLLKYNGGDVELSNENSVYIKAFGEGVNVDVLFGIKTKNPELEVDFWLNKYKEEMPKGTVIIGDSYQHGFFVMLCSGEEAGIYYWDDTREYPCSTDDNNTYFIANTFSDFINLLE